MFKPMSVLEIASALVFPAECEICASVLAPGAALGVCRQCASGIRLIGAPHCVSCGRTLKNNGPKCGKCPGEAFHFDRAFACAYYEGTLKELIHRHKFGGRKSLKNFFAELMGRFLQEHLSKAPFDAVVAVPLSQERLRERGFNQSYYLSSKIAEKLKKHDLSKWFTRKRSPSSQSLLSKNGRAVNVLGCFTVKDKGPFVKKNLLLVDDILTTGETASECAKTLKKAGASSVTVLALARGA